MIAKKVKNPKKSGTKSARVSGLVKYVREPEHENKLEKCVYQGARGFMFGAENAAEEMTALAEEAKRSADPIVHFVLSWQEGEKPTPEHIEQAVDIFLARLGLEDHQCVYGLHNDTDNMHLHIVINRVHPDTLKVTRINNGFDIEAAHQAIAEIETAQGWKRETKGRYEVTEAGEVVKANRQQKRQPSSEVKDREVRTGERSAQRTAIEDAAPVIKSARSWKELHEGLAAIGMRYEREGSGAVIIVGDVAVKASTADRNATIGKLQARLGAYESSTAVNVKEQNHGRDGWLRRTVQLQHHTPEAKHLSEYRLRDLSGCRLASDAGRQKAKDLLPVDERAHRRDAERVRRPGDSGNGSTSKSRGVKHSPDFVRYQSRRQSFAEAKREAWDALKIQQAQERQALREQQAAARKDTLVGNWKGKGALLNAMKSILAAQQAAEKAELKERQEADKKRVREAYPPFPTFEGWLRRHVGHEAADDYRNPDRVKDSRIYGEARQVEIIEHKPRSRDIRDYKPRIEGREVRYQSTAHGADVFIDKGRNISMLNDSDPDAIRAALQLAAVKFGGKVHLTGNEAFKALATKIAAQEGIAVLNADLKPMYDQERTKLEDERRAQAEAQWQVRLAIERERIEAAEKAKEQPKPQQQEQPEPQPAQEQKQEVKQPEPPKKGPQKSPRVGRGGRR